jgi:hypothetical protein
MQHYIFTFAMTSNFLFEREFANSWEIYSDILYQTEWQNIYASQKVRTSTQNVEPSFTRVGQKNRELAESRTVSRARGLSRINARICQI